MATNIHVEFSYPRGDTPIAAEKIGLNATTWQMEAASVREVLTKLIELSPDSQLLCKHLYDDQGAIRYYWTIIINYEPMYGGRNGRLPHEFDAPLEDGDRIIFGPGA
jgi:hypothetical protein